MRHVPNALTCARVAAVPVLVWLLLSADGPTWAAWWVFVVAMATDFVDGYLARKYAVISNFGKLMDPIADKAMVGGALITLSALGHLWWIITAVIVGREVLITVLRLLVAGREVIAAAWAGKVKTVTQTVGLAVMLTPLAQPGAWWHGVGVALLVVAAVLTLTSGYAIIKGMTRR